MGVTSHQCRRVGWGRPEQTIPVSIRFFPNSNAFQCNIVPIFIAMIPHQVPYPKIFHQRFVLIHIQNSHNSRKRCLENARIYDFERTFLPACPAKQSASLNSLNPLGQLLTSSCNNGHTADFHDYSTSVTPYSNILCKISNCEHTLRHFGGADSVCKGIYGAISIDTN